MLFTDPLGGRLLPVYPRCNLESVPKKVGESKEGERQSKGHGEAGSNEGFKGKATA